MLEMAGTLYARKATLSITGSGGMVVNDDGAHGIGGEVILSDLAVNSTGGLTLNSSASLASPRKHALTCGVIISHHADSVAGPLVRFP